MKTKIQINSIFGRLLFEYECEDNTIAKTVTEAKKSGANLSWANLSGANLSWANLSGANLSWANLSGANLDKRYIQVACIGSAKRMTTYCFDDDIIWCGCFQGSLAEFESQVNKSHANNERYLKEYSGFINYVKSLK
jgi:hypothetical protein